MNKKTLLWIALGVGAYLFFTKKGPFAPKPLPPAPIPPASN